jgi:hypothetical protein
MKNYLPWILAGLLSSQAWATTEIGPNDTLDQIVGNADVALELARSGQYGPLSTRNIKLANAAHEKILEITAGKASLDELSADERASLAQARERLDQALRVKNRNRIVCIKQAKLGTRVAREECLSIAQREQRARTGRSETERYQRYMQPNARGEGGG